MLFTTREKKTKTRKEAPRKRRLRRTRHKDTDRTRDWKRKRKNRISRIDTRFSSVLLLEEEEGFIITFHYFQEYVHTHIIRTHGFLVRTFLLLLLLLLIRKRLSFHSFRECDVYTTSKSVVSFFFIGLFFVLFSSVRTTKRSRVTEICVIDFQFHIFCPALIKPSVAKKVLESKSVERDGGGRTFFVRAASS